MARWVFRMAEMAATWVMTGITVPSIHSANLSRVFNVDQA